MNRTLLIVICDFLLLSMLALARFDKKPPEPVQQVETATSIQDTAAADITDSLREALENEAKAREDMARKLEIRAKELDTQQARAESLEQEKSRLEGEQARLQRLREQLEAERAKLETQVNTSSVQVEQSRKDREKLLAEMAAAQERQRLLQAQLTKREEDLDAARQSLLALREQKSEAERDKAVLSTKLESAQVAQQRLEGEVTVLRSEKDAAHKQAERLAENVGDLAQAQKDTKQAISKEIRQVTPLSINTIYDNFRHNRGVIRFNAREALLLGEGNAAYEIYTVFVRNAEGRILALCQSARTPFRIGNLNGLRAVKAEMDLPGSRGREVTNISFLLTDPRVLVVPMQEGVIESAGVAPFLIEDAPFRFSVAVIITAGGEKYGEVPIRVSPGSTRYIEVQSSIANRLFGTFSPSVGDLVFSQNGNLMGFMVASNRAILLSNLTQTQTLALGDAFDRDAASTAGKILAPLIPEETQTRSTPTSGGGKR